MTLQSGGSISASDINIELRRSASADFSLTGAEERELAGKPTGPVSFSDFFGKSSEIVVNLSSGGAAITLQSLFTPSEWISETPKRVILPAGVERGNASTLDAAVTIGSTAWGGQLVFDVKGVISGKGGSHNSGVGGNAFQANRLGNSGQKLQLNIFTGAVLRGGGGGGGVGGSGGSGYYITETRDPPSGYKYSTTDTSYYIRRAESFPSPDMAWLWQGSIVSRNYDTDGDTPSQNGTFPGRYFQGPLQYETTGNGKDGQYAIKYYSIARTYDISVSTGGGSGGSGGRGQGYDGARTSGSAGTPGGTNAGTGGDGGTGGLYGSNGFTGATGTNGNVSSGGAGAGGGAAGYGLLGTANVTLTNNGSILGRTG